MTLKQARDYYGDEIIEQVLERMSVETEESREFLERYYADLDDSDLMELPVGWERFLTEVSVSDQPADSP
jgi:hypothetical protein